MEQMTWNIKTSEPGVAPEIFSEYVINDLGVFVKRESHVSKKAPLHAATGFRIGYKAIPGKDYRAAPIDRNAILWHKVTCADEYSTDGIIIRGNRNSVIDMHFLPENREAVLRFIEIMRTRHPAVAAADYTAAAWLCWRDDDEWEDPFAPLADMIEAESGVERFIEPEILEETILLNLPSDNNAASSSKPAPKFCVKCGAAVYPDSSFCDHCGTQVTL